MRAWVPVALSLLSACKPGETDSQPVEAAVEAAVPTECRSRGQMKEQLRPKPYVVPGDGYGTHCLGDPIPLGVRSLPLGACRESGDTLTCRVGGVELSYTAKALRSIRLHWYHRQPQAELQVRGPLFPTGNVELGGSPDQLVAILGKPSRIETRIDADFGPLEVWHYDGLDVEMQRYDGGSVIGGLTIHARD